jgi:hypothetical protein
MGKPISLKLLVDEMDFQMEDYFTVVNKQTGEIVSVSRVILRLVEDDEIDIENHPDWEQDMIRQAIDMIENEMNYVEIPSRYEINEYDIMEDFSLGIEPSKLSDKLSRAIQGRGAFRRFKDLILELGVENQWHNYKKKRLREIAEKWCQVNGIDYASDAD